MIIFYSDKQIIEDIKSTNKRLNDKALKYIYDEYYNMAADIIRKRGGNMNAVPEVFHDSIISLYESIKEGRFHQRASVKTFLFSIIRNKWVSSSSRDSFLTGYNEQVLDAEYLSYIPETNSDEARNDLLKRCLDNLGEPCNELLVCYYYEKMSMNEIMVHMNYKSEDSTKSQKYKCLKRLIDYIENTSNMKYTLKELL